VRLWVVLARNGDTAVVFRLGPSKQVLLIRWQRGDDSLFPGQWFKGRIYERRYDLSWSGGPKEPSPISIQRSSDCVLVPRIQVRASAAS